MSRSKPPKTWQENEPASPIESLSRSIADLEARIQGLNARSRRGTSRSENLGSVSEAVMRQRMLERDQQQPQKPVPAEQRPAPLVQRESAKQQASATQSAMRETSGAMRDIAEALVSLRDDLRRDISENMNREFGSLRRDVDEIKAMTGNAAKRPDLAGDLAQIANQLEALENRRSDSQAGELQTELDDLRRMVNELASEESMRRLENRWDGLEEQISGLDPSASLREDLVTLSYRLDEIKSSIGQLPSALPLNQLEDKIKMLVAAIDAMARQPAAADPEIARQFAMVDDRLDEISRAIVASSVSTTSGVAPADIERLESRLESVIESVAKIAEAEASNIQHLQSRLDAVADSVSQSAAAEASNIRQLEERLNTVVDSVTKSAKAESANILKLEDRLAAVIDGFTQSAGADVSNIQKLEARLQAVIDDIGSSTRSDASAIQHVQDRLEAVIESVTQSAAADSANLHRLENRLDSVVDHIGRLDQAQRDDQLPQRLEALSTRVEELASEQPYAMLLDRLDHLSESIGEQSSSTDPQLVGQLEEIARKVESLDFETVNAHLGDQLKALSLRIDNINGDLAATNSNQDMLYGRLEDLAERVEVSVAQQSAMDLSPLEKRLSEIADRLDAGQSRQAPNDDSIRNLETQVANLSKLIASSEITGGASPDLDTRLTAIEDQLLSGRAADHDMVIETARQAAEAAVASYQQSGAPVTEVSAIETLVGDLRSLEDLSRKSEERNARTIDAVHGTLMKIAGRLDRLETGEPAPETEHVARAPEEPAFEASSETAQLPDDAPGEQVQHEEDNRSDKAFLSGLMQRMTATQDRVEPSGAEVLQDIDPAPSIDPVEDIDPETANTPLEPGSGAPDIKRIMAKVREAQHMADDDGPYKAAADQAKADKADFIAAARRAARAAASEAADIDESEDQQVEKSGSLGQAIKKRRRPLLLAAGAILLAVLSYPLISGMFSGNGAPLQTAMVEPAAETESQIPAVTLPVPVTEESIDEVQISKGDGNASDGILVTRQSSGTGDPGPSNYMSPSNEIQISNTFLPSQTADSMQTQSTSVDSSEPQTMAAAPTNAVGMSVEPSQITDDAATQQGVRNIDQMAAVGPQDVDSTEPLAAIEAPPQEAGPAALREAAAGGDPLALFEIGARYSEGRGVTTDLREAAKWYELAAQRGFAPAQYRLANFYEKGTGIERDLPKAMVWYERAAEHGNASAMHNLAVLHAMGQNGQSDYDTAGDWFTKAANLGVKDSQYNLAILHARGSGVPQDLEESYKWFAIAADGGDKDAAEKRDEVANALSPEQLDSARAKAELWKPAAMSEDANSVLIPSEWRGVDTRTASVDMEKAVRNIQAILTKNGFDTGGVDGVMGQKTVAAIKAFQTSIGMEPTGKVDDALVKELLARNN